VQEVKGKKQFGSLLRVEEELTPAGGVAIWADVEILLSSRLMFYKSVPLRPSSAFSAKWHRCRPGWDKSSSYRYQGDEQT